MAKGKTARTVYVVLAVSVEKATPAPYVVGVYEDIVHAQQARDQHAREVLAVVSVEEATYLSGFWRAEPIAKTKGR